MKRFLVLVGVFACSNEASPSKPVAPVVTPIAVADAAVALAPPDARDIRAELKLPARNVDAKEIIWRTEPEVANAIGKGTKRPDGKYRHELGDGEWFLVVYDKGRAVGVEVMTAAPGWERFDKDKANYLGETFFGLSIVVGADGTKAWSKVRDRSIAVGDSFGGTGLAAYDEKYIAALDAKVEREAKALADREAAEVAKAEAASARLRPARETFVTGIVEGMAEEGIKLGLELGEPDTTAKVTSGCSEKVIAFLVNTAGQNFRNVGFKRIVCADGSAAADL